MSNLESTEVSTSDKWYESTLPISITVVLSVILLVLIIIRIVQCCKQRKVDQTEKKAKAKARSVEEGRETVYDEVERSNAAAVSTEPTKGGKKSKSSSCCKKSKKHDAETEEVGALIVPTNENGSLLQSGIRAHPARKPENKSWYDSKVIPFIDETDQSLENLYLPENAIHEAV